MYILPFLPENIKERIPKNYLRLNFIPNYFSPLKMIFKPNFLHWLYSRKKFAYVGPPGSVFENFSIFKNTPINWNIELQQLPHTVTHPVHPQEVIEPFRNNQQQSRKTRFSFLAHFYSLLLIECSFPFLTADGF